MTTKAMRDIAHLEKLRVYDVAVVKVQFHDRTVLSARFHPREPLAALYAVVRGVLDAPHAADFSLFVAPPKRPLDEESRASLLDEGLVPAAKVFVSWARGPPTGDFLNAASRALVDAEGRDEAFPEAKAVAPEKQARAAAAAKPANAAAKKKPSWLKM